MKKNGFIVSAIFMLCFLSEAKNTYSAFSAGLAMPTSSAAQTPTGEKELKPGWEAGWTFFGLPLKESWNALSGLAFGGKISFNRWVRDSTWKDLYFLGTQGIVRYYLPLNLNKLGIFGQTGVGMFIGEHGFSDADTLDRNQFPTPPIVFKGIKNIGFSFNVGINYDVLEFTPGITMVFTKEKTSTWFSLNAAAKF